MSYDKQFDSLIGKSEQIKKICRLIGLIAKTKSTILIQGESGTGKEVVANAIYMHSLRNGAPFIKVNCAALSETLLESELFGHKKGSFTGAFEDRKGFFELANMGTIMLDEIGSMPLSGQAKLLRVLQEEEITPVGSARNLKIDVRVIATTNVVLNDATKKGMFREDLYYRLGVVTIFLPPLRDRKEDLSLLTDYFVEFFNTKLNKKVKGITEEAVKYLMDYDWPGNVRELRNVIENAMIMTETDYIELDAIPPLQMRFSRQSVCSVDLQGADLNLRNQLKIYERLIILNALQKSKWVKSKTAKLLGIDRRNLGYFIRKHDIVFPDDRPAWDS
ncbi:sigma-54-dependent Fis family transcriptional regulator [bacterium]|nr:sigma-54-dependent Fis family transcriptional regulator [bacterium]